MLGSQVLEQLWRPAWSESRLLEDLHVRVFVHEATGKLEDPGASYRVDCVSKAAYWS